MHYRIVIDGLADGKIQWNISFSNAPSKGDTEERQILGIVKEFINNLEALRGMHQGTE